MVTHGNCLFPCFRLLVAVYLTRIFMLNTTRSYFNMLGIVLCDRCGYSVDVAGNLGISMPLVPI